MSDMPLIHDRMPDSWQEVYLANALDKYNIPYFYQYLINQRASLRGSIWVDFVIIKPRYQAIEIFGRYWHEGGLGADDRWKLGLERRYFGRETIVVWSDELPDQEAANNFVKREIL